jgi:hypothetical protein
VSRLRSKQRHARVRRNLIVAVVRRVVDDRLHVLGVSDRILGMARLTATFRLAAELDRLDRYQQALETLRIKRLLGIRN